MSSVACYLVQRVAWDGEQDQGFAPSRYRDSDLIRRVPVAVFATEQQAKADAHRRNVEVKAGWSPFWFEDHWGEFTGLTPEDVATRLSRKGLPSPQPRHPDDIGGLSWRTLEMWRQWWDRESANWTTEQLADAWAVFNKLQFYDVIEIEMED